MVFNFLFLIYTYTYVCLFNIEINHLYILFNFQGVWSQEAYDVLSHLTAGVVGQAQIEAYSDSTVYISLYINIPKHGVSYFMYFII